MTVVAIERIRVSTLSTPARVLLIVVGILALAGGSFGVYTFVQSRTPAVPATGFQLEVSTPTPGQKVPGNGFPITGTSTGARPDSILWAASIAQQVGATYQPQDIPCEITLPAGDWNCAPFYLGGNGDAGKKYDVILYSATQEAAQAFVDYNRQKPPGAYPGLTAAELPRGLVELARITVTRS